MPKSKTESRTEDETSVSNTLSDEEIAVIENKSEGLVEDYYIPEDKLPPVYIEGEPFCIIREKYVPYDEAQVVFQERKIKKEQAKLVYLKAKRDRNAKVRKEAEAAIAKLKKSKR